MTLNLVFLLATGARDVTGLLHWIVKMLGDNPEWNEKVRSRDAPPDLPSRVVFETLRLAQSEVIMRKVLEPFEIDGFVVPADWYLRVCVKESHSDAAIFPNPSVFDPDRFLGTRFGRNEYSPFGMRLHSCVGVGATVTIACALVHELSGRYDWTLVRDGPPEFDRFHWRPNRNLRVALNPLQV